ncbi:hypothetical protein PkoCFBP13504_24545 [Pseudomonas koreensis]|uniref:hypothetical protein n=1 Tax=Pseudomonas koreensis TaxID=198620 RepID=UPI0010C14338|nr:hypothetical protein [Pseudomonas koreensis]TKJ76748.1 hypothetical protein PkoCFBP13504_24545 [Pseudomonas koreensis]
MAITNNCFLNWSEECLKKDDLCETDYRTIISRSYYSAYHEVLSLADNELGLGVGSMVGPSHLKLSETLTNFICDDKSRQKVIRRIGARMSALHSMRIRADYYFDLTLNDIEAKSLVKNVNDVFRIIKFELQESAA